MELTFILMKNTTRENGMETSEVAGVECISKMEQFMKANGMTTRGTVRAC